MMRPSSIPNSCAMLWEREGDTYCATARDLSGAVVCHLVVEALPDGTWTWTAWRPGDPPRLVRDGTAGTVQEAMRAAEQGAQ
jgi:hypothetical protein